MELISCTIYNLKVHHKIFIMFVVAKENLSSITEAIFMHELCKQVLPHIPATVAWNNLVPFIIPTSWMTRRWTTLHWGREVWERERKGSRLHTLPLLYLLSDIYTMFYQEVCWGELLRCIMPCFRCHTELHYTVLSVWGTSSDVNQYITLHFFPFK